MPATDFGFVFDIYKLDNSFNLTINGTQMASKEINFQGMTGRPAQFVSLTEQCMEVMLFRRFCVLQHCLLKEPMKYGILKELLLLR